MSGLVVVVCMFVFVAWAGAERVTVEVKGMACPFCAYNIEKRIKTLEGVPEEANYEASVAKSQVSFDWKAGVPVDEAGIREEIDKAGFTAGGIEVAEGEGMQSEAKKGSGSGTKGGEGAGSGSKTSSAIDAGRIEAILGAEAQHPAEGVVKVGWVRDEVAVEVDGMAFPPAAGLGSWASFKPGGEEGAIVMGDTVVFEDEVDAAMDAALGAGLRVTALHNHFFYDEPKVYFMHIGGHGTVEEMAKGVDAVWEAIRGVRAERAEPAERFGGEVPESGGEIDAERIEEITGLEPSVKAGGVVKVSVGREGKAHGVKVGGGMGLGTWAAFVGDDELASMDGDFIMRGGEVQAVLRALREHGIHVVALHNHMIGEAPQFYFVHFWGKGSVEELARGFRAVLDAQRQVEVE